MSRLAPPALLIPIPPLDESALVRLAADVIAARPRTVPTVPAGVAGAAEWMSSKRFIWSRIALVDGQVVGHVGVRDNTSTPDGLGAPTGHDRELCRLMVHPRYRRQGIGALLVDAAVGTHGQRLWATVPSDRSGHRLLAGRDWSRVRRTWLPEEGAPGFVLASAEVDAPTRWASPHVSQHERDQRT